MSADRAEHVPAPIYVVDYDPGWSGRFALLHAQLSKALGPLAEAIAHVGSTSVPGLAAKPTIDISVLLASPNGLAAATRRLHDLGYRHEGERGVAGRHAFANPEGIPPHDHHLYVCLPDCVQHRDQIAFRDHLRANPGTAAEYATLKRGLAALFRNDRTAYTEAKSGFVQAVLRKARGEGD